MQRNTTKDTRFFRERDYAFRRSLETELRHKQRVTIDFVL